MRNKSTEILHYLYKHKIQNNLNGASLIELPNTDGVNDLYHGGYVNLEFNKDNSIKKVAINGKGIDWVKEHAITIKPDNARLTLTTSEASINNEFITIKVRSEIYNHIKPYLDSEDYFHAVEEAYKVVREKLRDNTGLEKATDIFNMNAENARHYEVLFSKSIPESDAEKDFFRGVGYLHLGIQFLRNEKSHSLATAVEKNLALHYISLASLAYDLISRNSE